MGLFSVTMNTLVLTPASFLFSPFVSHGNLYSLIIALFPRILIGVTPYFVYRWIHNRTGLVTAAIVGSMTNTILFYWEFISSSVTSMVVVFNIFLL